jgi:O-antigen/teichoic acid export membrane protein
LKFRTLALVGLVSNAISGAAAIVAALNGAGVWALAINILLSTAVSSALLWVVHDWRPRLVFSPRSIAHYLSFGGLVSIANILQVIYSGGFSLLIGKFHGLRDVGLYNRASNTQGLPSGIISALIGRVALPLFAARQGDPEAHKRGLRSANEFTMLLNLPAMAGLALLSDLVIEVLFGSQWSEAAPILSILAVGGILLPLHSNNVFALLGRGRSKLFIRNELLKTSFGAVAVISATPFGITAVAYAQVIYSVVALAINTAPSRRELAYGAWSQLRDLRGLLLTTLAMSLAVAAVKLMMGGPTLLVLAICVIAGAVSYVAVGFLFGVAAFRNAHEVFRQLLNRGGQVEMSDAMLASDATKTIV